MRKSVKVLLVLLFVIGFALYLNIGWAIGTYMHNNVAYKSVESGSLLDKFLAGPDHDIFSEDISAANQHSLLSNQVMSSIFWPLLLVLIVVLWIVCFIYLLLWLVFAGGIAKLFGVG